MDYLKAVVGPYLTDKHLLASVALWLLKLANLKLGLGLDDVTLTTLAGAFSTWTGVHLIHSNTVGANQ